MLVLGNNQNGYKIWYTYNSLSRGELCLSSGVPVGTYWTDFRTDIPDQSKRVTGSTQIVECRIELSIGNNSFSDYFFPDDIKWHSQDFRPSATFETRNRKEIPKDVLRMVRIFKNSVI